MKILKFYILCYNNNKYQGRDENNLHTCFNFMSVKAICR